MKIGHTDSHVVLASIFTSTFPRSDHILSVQHSETTERIESVEVGFSASTITSKTGSEEMFFCMVLLVVQSGE